jgi:hypothetical protein
MAQEIIIIEEVRDRAEIVFLYPIPTPATVAGQNVVPTPATVDAVEVLGWTLGLVLTAPEKADLDAGDLAYERLTMRRLGDSNPAFLARIQAKYATRSAAFASYYATRYAQAGERFDTT